MSIIDKIKNALFEEVDVEINEDEEKVLKARQKKEKISKKEKAEVKITNHNNEEEDTPIARKIAPIPIKKEEQTPKLEEPIDIIEEEPKPISNKVLRRSEPLKREDLRLQKEIEIEQARTVQDNYTQDLKQDLRQDLKQDYKDYDIEYDKEYDTKNVISTKFEEPFIPVKEEIPPTPSRIFNQENYESYEEKQEEPKAPPTEVPIYQDDFEQFQPEVNLYKTSKEEYIKRNTATEYGHYEKIKSKKTFKPSPNISPIYGIIDENNITVRPPVRKEVRLTSATRNEKVGVDDIRKKAYGAKKENIRNEQPEENSDELKDNIMIDLRKNDAPEVKKVTIEDAEEYFEDLGLEYNTDYIDVTKAKAGGRRLRSEDNPKVEENKETLPSFLTETLDTNQENNEKINKNNIKTSRMINDNQRREENSKTSQRNIAVYNDNPNDDNDDDDDDNLFDLIDSMYDK